MISNYKEDKKWVMFPGRWQPLHNGHMAIISQALDQGKNVWIAIRDTKISEKDPYTVEQRIQMVKRAFGDLYGKRVIATPIPDIEGIRYSRNVGYNVEEIIVPKKIGEISATNVRAGKETSVHPEVEHYTRILNTTIWLTGLPCAGKTTLAKRLKEEIENMGYKVAHLDGDDVRGKLNEDLDFSHEHRKENLRRVAHVAKLFNENNTIVLASFVSPVNELRKIVQEIIGNIKMIYINCSLEECERRDVKGMYAKARAGEIKDFTGVGALFEEPENPDLIVDTETNDIETCVRQIISSLKF